MTWKGTPGPWKAERNEGCKRITAKDGPQHRQAKRTEVMCTPGLWDEAEDRANARGAAAVPDMVAALLAARDLLKPLSTHGGMRDGLHTIEDALKLAGVL